MECSQLVYGNHVRHDWQLAWFATLIDPPKDGDTAATNDFVHQAYTNDPVYAAYAARDYGMEFEVIDNASMMIEPLPGHGQHVELRVPATGPHYELIGAIDVQGNRDYESNHAFVFQGDDGLGEFSMDYASSSNTASPATASYHDGSYWRAHSELPQTHGTTIHDIDAALTHEYRLL
jgi:hypothetical protein